MSGLYFLFGKVKNLNYSDIGAGAFFLYASNSLSLIFQTRMEEGNVKLKIFAITFCAWHLVPGVESLPSSKRIHIEVSSER